MTTNDYIIKFFSTRFDYNIKASGSEIDELLRAGISGPELVVYMEGYDALRKSFDSFGEVIAAICRDKEEILDYLSREDCTLVSSRANETTADQLVTRLIEEAKAGPDTLFLLKHLNEEGLQFESVSELAKVLKSTHAEFTQRQYDVLYHIESAQCRLFDRLQQAPVVTPLHLSQLFKEGMAGRDTMTHIWNFEVNGQEFLSWEQLVQAVRGAHIEHLRLQRIRDIQIEELLSGPRGVLSFEMTEDLFRHLMAGKTSAEVLFHLQEQAELNRRFTTADSFVAAMQESHIRSLHEREQLIVFLSNPACPLFRDANNAKLVVVNKVGVDRLYFECQGGASVIEMLHRMVADGKQFSTLKDLIGACKVQATAVKLLKHRIFEVLTNPQNTLWSRRRVKISLRQCYELMRQCRSGDYTMGYLEAFQAQGKSFQSFEDLMEALKESTYEKLKSLHKPLQGVLHNFESLKLDSELDSLIADGNSVDELEFLINHLCHLHRKYQNTQMLAMDLHDLRLQLRGVQTELQRYLNSPLCKLMHEQRQTVSAQHVVRLTTETGAGIHAMDYVWYLSVDGYKFASFEELVQAVTDKTAEAILRTEEDRTAIVRLLAPKSPLFVDHSNHIFSTALLDALLEACGSVPATLSYMTDFTRSGTKFQNTSHLLESLKIAKDKAEQSQKELFKFMTSSNFYIFDGAPITITFRDIARLWHDGDAGLDSLYLVRTLNDAGMEFLSFMDLVLAVRFLNLEFLDKKQELYEFLCDPASSLLRLRSDGLETSITLSHVNRLFQESGAGACTIMRVKNLAAQGLQYDRLELLIAAVRLEQEKQRLAVRQCLIASKSVAFDIESVRTATLDHILSMCGIPRKVELHLRDASAAGIKFLSAEELTTALKNAQTTWSKIVQDEWISEVLVQAKMEVLTFIWMNSPALISSTPGRNIFPTKAPAELLPSLLYFSLQGDEPSETSRSFAWHSQEYENAKRLADVHRIDLIFFDHVHQMCKQNGRDVLKCLQLLIKEECQFSCNEDLVKCVVTIFAEIRKHSNAQRSKIHEYLSRRGKESLLSTDEAHSEADVHYMIVAGRSTENTLYYLEHLCLERHTFADVLALANGIKDADKEARECKEEIRQLLQGDMKMCFGDKGRTGAMMIDCLPWTLTESDLDRIYVESGAGPRSYVCLRAAHHDEPELCIENVGDIVKLVAKYYSKTKETLRDAKKKQTLEYLMSPDCNLLSNSILSGLSNSELEVLWTTDATNSSSLYVLEQLNREHRHFKTLAALVEAAQELDKDLKLQLDEVWEYLSKKSCPVLAIEEIKSLKKSQVMEILRLSGCGFRLLEFCKVLAQGRPRYARVADLTTALVTHQQQVKIGTSEKLLAFLISSRCKLLPDTLTADFTLRSLEQFETSCGHDVLSSLFCTRNLNDANKHFPTVEALTDSLRELYGKCLEHRSAVFRYLHHSGRALLSADVSPSMTDCIGILAATNAGKIGLSTDLSYSPLHC